jgi:hypothetical protein
MDKMTVTIINTKNMPRLLLKLIAASLVGVGMLLPAMPVSAAGASISLTANHSSIAAGGTLIVAVYMNGGGNPINAVEADLNYPASKLEYVGLSYSGGAFGINTPGNGGGNGVITIQNGSVSPVSGSGLVATVTFKALAASGSAAIGVSGSSNLINANTNTPVAYGSSGITVNLGGSAAPSSSSTSHASASPSHPNAASAPAAPPPKDVTPPAITAIKVRGLTSFRATITWTTNEPSSSEVDYGLDASYGLSNSSTALTTTHSVTLNSTFLTPETVFHYHVKSGDAAGNTAASPDQHFSLPGVPVTIVVLGANGKPEANATVTLDGATSTTDSHGQVTLPSSLGNKKITTTYEGVTVQRPFTVNRSAKPLPPYQLDLAKQPLNHWMMTSAGLVVVILILLGIDALLFGSHFFVRLAGLRLAPTGLLHLRGSPGPAAVLAPAVSADTIPPADHSEADKPSLPPPPAAEAGFNVQTTSETPTPPSLRAIDNIQPLSLRRSPAPAPPLATVPTQPTRINITEPVADEPPTVANGTEPEAKAAPAKKHRVRKTRKSTKRSAKPAAPQPS